MEKKEYEQEYSMVVEEKEYKQDLLKGRFTRI